MQTLKVLVVDDELGMRLGVERTLSRYSFVVSDFDEEVSFSIRKAGDGKEAFAAIEEELPDILILDHKLPDIQGLDILVEIGKRKLELLTIMVTAYASLEVAVSATKSGAFDFLAKPFTPDELKSIIRKAARHIFLHRRAKQLEAEKRQVRFQFISVLAHELKSPLAAVEGYLRIVDKQMLGESIQKYESMIARSLARLDGMRKMIFDLLDLTRIESGQKNRELTAVDLVEAAKNSIDGVLPDANQRGIKIELHAPPQLAMTADSGEIEIILNNFLTNAVKYNKDNGSVDLTIEAIDGGVKLTCADTGIGMSAEEQERLFGEFVRIKNEKTRAILGSGLGLSIVKKLLSFYNGTVTVASEPDVGSTFTITLKEVAPQERDSD